MVHWQCWLLYLKHDRYEELHIIQMNCNRFLYCIHILKGNIHLYIPDMRNILCIIVSSSQEGAVYNLSFFAIAL